MKENVVNIINDTKQYYLDKLNKEICYVDDFLKSTDTIKKRTFKKL